MPLDSPPNPLLHITDLAQYDAVLVAAGNSNEYEGEGFDHSFDLPEYQNLLIQSIAKVNPNTVVTLHGGTGLKMSDWIDQVPAALHAFYPGQNGGQALAEILLGKVNPSAKLPISIERNIEDNPIYATFPKFDNQETLAETGDDIHFNRPSERDEVFDPRALGQLDEEHLLEDVPDPDRANERNRD